MTGRLFYLSVSGEPGRGPISEEEIRADLQSGKLPGTAVVCEVGSSQWRTLDSLDGEPQPPSFRAPPIPPPPPPQGHAASSASPRSSRLPWLIVGVIVGGLALAAVGVVALRFHNKPKLCKASSRIAATLTNALEIKAFVVRGTPKLDKFVVDLEALLRRYEAAGQGKVRVQILDGKDPMSRAEAIQNGLQESAFGEATESNDAKIVSGFLGIVFKYGAESDRIPILSPENPDGIEFWITNKIRELRAKAEGKVFQVGVLTGHDEIKLSESNLVNVGEVSMASVISQNMPYYKFVDVDLHGGDQDIDDQLVGLVVTQPAKDLSEKELRRIDRFVMTGHSLAVFASAVNVKAGDATMQGSLSTHGLDRLLSGYGMGMRRDLVIDAVQPVRINVTTRSGVVSVAFPDFVNAAADASKAGAAPMLDASHPIFFRLDSVSLPFASSIDLQPSRQPNAIVRVLARSSGEASRMTTDALDLRPMQTWPKLTTEPQMVLAAVASGRLNSAFPSGDKMGVDAPAHATKDTRVLLIASSQFLANPIARAARAPALPGGPPAFGGDEQLLLLAAHLMPRPGSSTRS